jgi:ketosteroid isomerase-like protein
MSERDRIVRAVVDAFNSGDMTRVAEYMHPEVLLRQPLPDVGPTAHRSFVGTYRGRSEVVEILEELVTTLNGVKFELRRTEEVGDDGILCEALTLIGPEAERSAQMGWYLSRFRDGMIFSTTAYGTEAAAREAIARGA